MLSKSELMMLNKITQFKFLIPTIMNCRHGHFLRGKRPGIAKSLEQRLAEERTEDQEVLQPVNIGFPKLNLSRSQILKERLSHLKAQRKNSGLEKQARSNTLLINLDDVKEEYEKTAGQFHLKTVAEHYGIFKDLYGLAYFVPRVPLKIKYKTSDGAHIVYNGNIIKPNEAAQEPEINFDTKAKLLEKNEGSNYWTLIMTTPDGHFSGENKEYIHWFKANIPEDNITKGETIISYLQPFPPKGIGYQRYVFVLYKQNMKLNFDSYKVNEINDLNKRTFSTLEFYRKYQNDITPAGLSFFQSDWDSSLTELYHNVLNLKEPIFEYDFPAPYIADEKWFPLKQPFNLYLDKHRDPKKVHQEYLEKKLAKTHPFNGPEPGLRFPNAQPLKDIPSWLKTEIRKDRLKMGRINDI